MNDNYTAVFGTTSERDLRMALKGQSTIYLTPPNGMDEGSIECTALVGNYQWLRLTFTGSDYTYYFDNTKGWYYVPNNKVAGNVGESLAALELDVSGKVDADQGVESAGKFLVVGDDGIVTTVAMPIWEGGNF